MSYRFVRQGGTYVVDLLMIYGPGISVLFIVFVEAVAVCWFYGANRWAQHCYAAHLHRIQHINT